MTSKVGTLGLLVLFTIFSVRCERLYGRPSTISVNPLTSLETRIASLETQIENKDELIAMLRIKTSQEQEEIQKQLDQISSLNTQISNLNKELSAYLQQTNKCQSSSCMCQSTGTHSIKVPGSDPFQVFCDSSLAGDGWTVIQRRSDGSVNFNRNWRDYQAGFGDLKGEFFLGLYKLHLLTKSQPHQLYIYLQSLTNESRYALYDNFEIANEDASFEISSLGGYSGTAGDAMVHHKNMKFSTFDMDNDNSARNCADENSSGWWFNNCYRCNLNGQYNSGFYWYPWQSNVLKFAQIMIRPKAH